VKDLADKHAGHAEVVSVLARAGGLSRGVDERDRFSNNRKFRHREFLICEF
jgi:hypothetical protein